MSTLPLMVAWLAGTLLPLGALWLLFQCVLRAEQCFGYNRVVLLLAPVVAGALPLLPRPEWPRWLPEVATAGSGPATVLLPTLQATASPAGGAWPGWAWLLGLYVAGVVVGLVQLAYQAGRLYQTAHRLPREARPGYTLVYTGGQLPTSSFGNTIFWDETADLTAAEASAVLSHELAHVQQGHTYDILWLELWRAVLWVNPFMHLLLPALRLTHELLADRAATHPAALASTGPALPYTALLARLATRQLAGSRYSTLLQPFTFSFTLTRIAMLQNRIPVRRWKQWLALPVLAGLFLLAGRSASAQSVPPPPPPMLIKGSPAAAPAPGQRKVYTYVEQMPQLPGGGNTAAIIKAILDKLVYPKLEKSAQRDGTVFASFVVAADGRVEEPSIVKGLSAPYDEAVLAAVRQLPRFVPGKQNGKSVAVSFTVPVKFQQADPK